MAAHFAFHGGTAIFPALKLLRLQYHPWIRAPAREAPVGSDCLYHACSFTDFLLKGSIFEKQSEINENLYKKSLLSLCSDLVLDIKFKYLKP